MYHQFPVKTQGTQSLTSSPGQQHFTNCHISLMGIKHVLSESTGKGHFEMCAALLLDYTPATFPFADYVCSPFSTVDHGSEFNHT